MNNKKVILISGGAGLLGNEWAKSLSEDENNEVIILDLQDKIREYHRKYYINGVQGYGIDITKEEEVIHTINFIYEHHNRIDTLINCAAVNPQPKEGEYNTFERYSLEKWKKTLDVNLTGAFLLSRECIKYMLKNKIEKDKFRGTIINVTSQLGFVSPNQDIYEDGYCKPADYAVAASGIISLTRYLACYYGGIIKVNCLIPSMVENGQSKEFIKNAEKLIPMGRMSKKDEFNSAIKFLCSENSSYMTGQSLICDGGYISW